MGWVGGPGEKWSEKRGGGGAAKVEMDGEATTRSKAGWEKGREMKTTRNKLGPPAQWTLHRKVRVTAPGPHSTACRVSRFSQNPASSLLSLPKPTNAAEQHLGSLDLPPSLLMRGVHTQEGIHDDAP